MNDLFLEIIKHLSKYDINMKENYQIYRNIQNKTPLQKKAKTIKEKEFTYHIFTPKHFETKKTIIYLHGGGWVAGSTKFYSFLLYHLANELKRNIITFDYPLAPEHPFPEGLNFCYKAIKELFNNPNKYGIDASDMIIMGDSAGANLATVICLKAKKLIEDYLSMYITNDKDYKNKYVAPLYAKNLFGMPETLIITADLDPLRDEGHAYAKKLKRYFNKVTYYNMKGVIHGFFNNFLYFKENHHVIKIIKRFVGDKSE